MTAAYTPDPVTLVATALRLVWVSNMAPARMYVQRLSPDELRTAKTVAVRLACLIETVLYQPLEEMARAAARSPDPLPNGVEGAHIGTRVPL